MSKPTENKGKGGDATPAAKCPVGGCSHKVERSAFCKEHFVWFKEGLINRKGERPKDFDRKYQGFMLRQRKAA